MIDKDIKNESADEAKVSQLLQGLSRVEAPRDFEFRVKARIASADKGQHRPKSFLPVLRYAMPLGLVLFVGAFFAFSGLYNSDPQGIPVVAETRVSQPLPAAELIPETIAKSVDANSPLPLPVDTPAREKFTAARVKNDRGFPARRRERPTGLTDGSAERALTPAKIISAPAPKPDKGELSADGFLTVIGINAEFEQSGWKVRSVKANSPAERFGLKSGDVVEAVDDRKIDDKTMFKGNFRARSLKVLRENKPVTLTINNR